MRLQIVEKLHQQILYAHMDLPGVVLSERAEAVVPAKEVECCIYRTHTERDFVFGYS